MDTQQSNRRASSAEQLATRVLDYTIEQQLDVGAHIKEVELSKVLKVSRTPIRSALAHLQQQGYLTKKPNQGFFLAKLPERDVGNVLTPVDKERRDLAPICYQIGQDYLSGKLNKTFSENELMARYQLSRKAIQEALLAMEKDSWLNRNIGYGWGFNEFISSPTAYAQSYRFRQLIEPEALRDPGFSIDHTTLQMLRMAQIDILNNDQKLVSAAEMFNAGVQFHEALVAMSGNIFLLDALQRVNRLRRLVEYNVNGKRPIPRRECQEHIQLLELIETGQLQEAALFLETHLARAAKEKEQIAQELFG
ncbi:GntR family transcriptional regulator [Aliagarivorans marinus]|uniref:GntR family transcriptional regulator n=1 Tax=Aliagarivorans marinus TaxID=561965 RepID=UPI0004036712|nr:GntR family transcriptional regulator [Aliagarivorans marinus]